jgi:hypothetical protein
MPISDSDFNRLAQINHSLLGIIVPTLTKILSPTTTFFWSYLYVWMTLLLVAYSAYKEFIWDEKNEDPEVRGSSLEDFLFQAGFGVGTAAIIFVSKFWL